MVQYVVTQLVTIIFKGHSAFIRKDQAGQENGLILKSEGTTVI
jgi:hypothetical protein